MRVADAIAERLKQWGVEDCFSVTGGGAMHLNDAFGYCSGIDVHYMHHEQACAIAGEAYARLRGRPAVVNVTAGPGAINALNGVFGAYTDSIPMIVVAGQVRSDTMLSTVGLPRLRQLGDQELQTDRVVESIVKRHTTLLEPNDVVRIVDEAVLSATSGRPGPVWIDIPVNVQGAEVQEKLLERPLPPRDEMKSASVDGVLTALASANRPVILAGSGVRISGTSDELIEVAESLQIPVLTAWTHDIFPSDHPLYAGRPGTIGTRAGNFILQAADLVVVLGSRLNIRQISYNWHSFAKDARVIWVDIDDGELQKPTVTPDVSIVADLASFLPSLAEQSRRAQAPGGSKSEWIQWIQDVRNRYEPKWTDYLTRDSGVNAYHLVMHAFDLMRPTDVIVCGDATACIVPFQVGRIVGQMRMFSNSGSASMGYDLPAALGAAVADSSKRVICFAGDGSVMMNLQELQTMKAWQANVALVVLANDGYLSIKQTQRNFFGREYGASSNSGVTFPDFAEVAAAFGLPTWRVTQSPEWKDQVREALSADGPRVCVVQLDLEQEFEPRLKSRMVDGVIQTPELDDMFPFLATAELTEVRNSARRGLAP